MPETCVTFGKFGARVMVEDQEVQHYAMHIDPVKKEVSCWIASEAGKKFSVVWLEHETKFPVRGHLYLDGRSIKGRARRKFGRHFDKGPTVFQDVSIADSLAVPYLFSPLVVTDDDAFLDSSSASVGEIKLEISHVTAPVLSTRKHVYKKLPQPQKIHERSKKAIAHQVNYGNETNVREAKWYYSTKTIERLVTFIFQYRPLEMLQANEIAPRNPRPLELHAAFDTPPTPITSSEKRKHSKAKEETDSEGEPEDEDRKREKALLAEVERIRQARHLKGDQHPNKKAKKEHKTFFIPGEVIDLT